MKVSRFIARVAAIRLITIAWVLLAAGVVTVSIALNRHTTEVTVPPRIAHFSGSVVVQNMPSVLESPRLGAAISVDILRDAASASYYDSPATLDSIVDAWRTVLLALGADVQIVDPDHAEAQRAQVLVIPSSPCLTISSRQAVESAAEDGRGLIITGLTGNRDIGCRAIGYGFVIGATNASRADLLESRSMVYVALPAGNPITDGIPPGSRLELKPGTQVALRGSSRDAYYCDYSLRPEPADSQPLLDAALARSMLGRARVVYWGFELRDVAASRVWNVEVARLLVRNSVNWAADAPTASVEPWPKGRIAAAAIAQDVEDQFEDAAFALDSLKALHFPGTYFLTTRLAKPYSRLSRAMAAEGEAGSHSENHWVVGGNPPAVQRRRLLETQHDLEDMLGHPARGFRPPEEQFDTTTLHAWAAAGGTYVFGANDQRSVSPEVLAVGADTVILIARYGNDDFAAARDHRGDRDAAEAVFLGDFDRVRALGGAYVLSYHSQLLARREWISVLASTARTLASDSTVWRATMGNIAAWWRARAGVTTAVEAATPYHVVVSVHNSGRSPIASLVVHVRNVTSRPPARSDAHLLPAAPGELRFLVPSLDAGSTRTYIVSYDVPRPREQAVRSVPHVAPRTHWSWRRLLPWPLPWHLPWRR